MESKNHQPSIINFFSLFRKTRICFQSFVLQCIYKQNVCFLTLVLCPSSSIPPCIHAFWKHEFSLCVIDFDWLVCNVHLKPSALPNFEFEWGKILSTHAQLFCKTLPVNILSALPMYNSIISQHLHRILCFRNSKSVLKHRSFTLKSLSKENEAEFTGPFSTMKYSISSACISFQIPWISSFRTTIKLSYKRTQFAHIPSGHTFIDISNLSVMHADEEIYGVRSKVLKYWGITAHPAGRKKEKHSRTWILKKKEWIIYHLNEILSI